MLLWFEGTHALTPDIIFMSFEQERFLFTNGDLSKGDNTNVIEFFNRKIPFVSIPDCCDIVFGLKQESYVDKLPK